MILTYKQFPKVTFPVYRVPSDNWYSHDGLLFIDGILVDDKNMPGETLGIRRLQTYFHDLIPLLKGIDTPTALIKQTGGPYIDSVGKCFIYEKTKFCKVKYYKIRKIEYKNNICLLWAKDLTFSFIIPRPPKDGYTWIGILHLYGLPWMLYEYAKSKQPDMRRKV